MDRLKSFGVSARPETLELKSEIQQTMVKMDPVHNTSMGLHILIVL